MLQPFDDWEVPMDKYICDVCGYIYDPEVGDPDGGIAPGTALRGYSRRLGMPHLRRRQGRLLTVRGLAYGKTYSPLELQGRPFGSPFPFLLALFSAPAKLKVAGSS